MRFLSLSLVALLFASHSGCTTSPDEVAPRTFPIVDGTREMGEEAVVLVKAVGGVASCTGTLVSESVVLTAKHCVQLQDAEEPFPVGLLTIGIGHDRADTVDYRARRIDTTPGAFGTGLTGLVGEDVAVITIRPDADGNLPDVTPIAYRRESPADLVDQEVTFIGFGQTDLGVSGLKYTRTGIVTGVGSGVISSAGNICQGDSGGPMILEGSPRQVVGVASFGRSATGDACPAIEDGHNAIDGHLGIIDMAIREAGGCPFEAAEECNSIDDDCDGGVDEGCAPLGSPCTDDGECANAQLPDYFGTGLVGLLEQPVICGDTPAGRVCTRPCDPLRPLTSCSTVENPFGGSTEVAVPAGLCVSTGGCEGTCVAQGTQNLGLEAPCSDDAECGTGKCVDPGDGERRCLQACMGDAAQCAVGEVCAAGAGACGACVDEGLVAGPRGFGEGCGSDGDCASGLCEGGFCSRPCTNHPDCGETFHCVDSVCRPGPAGDSGDLCDRRGDCLGSRACVGEPSVCALPCSDSCNEGFTCTEGHCLPETAVLGESCMADTDCVDGLCVDGSCTRECGVGGACPSGLECRRESSGRGLCRAPQGGGCSATGAPPAGGALFGLLALFAIRRRR